MARRTRYLTLETFRQMSNDPLVSQRAVTDLHTGSGRAGSATDAAADAMEWDMTPGATTDMRNRFLLLRDLANALRLEVIRRKFEYGGAEALQTYQEQQLRKVVRHAASHSPYYRQLCGRIDLAGIFQLRELPIVDKRLMMENFDA